MKQIVSNLVSDNILKYFGTFRLVVPNNIFFFEGLYSQKMKKLKNFKIKLKTTTIQIDIKQSVSYHQQQSVSSNNQQQSVSSNINNLYHQQSINNLYHQQSINNLYHQTINQQSVSSNNQSTICIINNQSTICIINNQSTIYHQTIKASIMIRIVCNLVSENILKYFGTFRLVVPNNMSPREKKLFQRLQASSSSLPATPELRSLLGGIPISTSGKKPADAIPFEKSSGKTASEEIYKTRLAEEMEPLRLKKDPSMPGIPDQGMHRLIKDVKTFKEKANKNAKNPPESGSDSTESTAKGSSGLEETALESTAKGSSGLEETALGSTAKGSSALVNSGLEETALEESSEDLKSSGPYKFVSRNPRKKTPKGDKKDPRNPISKDGTDGDVS